MLLAMAHLWTFRLPWLCFPCAVMRAPEDGDVKLMQRRRPVSGEPLVMHRMRGRTFQCGQAYTERIASMQHLRMALMRWTPPASDGIDVPNWRC